MIKPNFPDRGGHDSYEYLASTALTPDTLRYCCAVEGEVVGIHSRQSVNVLLNGVTYHDIPVWIHTDVGARAALLKGVESSPEDYFKDAALMFPFPGGVGYMDPTGTYIMGTSVDPKVLALVYTNPDTFVKEPICVFHILQNINSSFPSSTYPYPTYKMFCKVRISASNSLIGVGGYYDEVFLYDVIEGKVAVIPTLVTNELGSLVPSLPMVEAKGVTTDSAVPNPADTLITATLAASKFIPNLTLAENPTISWAPLGCGAPDPDGTGGFDGYYDGSTIPYGTDPTRYDNWTFTSVPPFDSSYIATSVFPGASAYRITTALTVPWGPPYETSTELDWNLPAFIGGALVGGFLTVCGDFPSDTMVYSTTTTYENGATYVQVFSAHVHGLSPNYTSEFSINTTLDFAGEVTAKAHTLYGDSNGSTSSTTHTLRTTRIRLVPKYPNFFHNAWQWHDVILAREDEYSSGTYSYTYIDPGLNNIFAVYPESCIREGIGTIGVIEFTLNRLSQLFSNGTLPFNDPHNYLAIVTTLDGFHFLPYDVREALL
jgi:hypothetical protein